jgi:hypothetical protein
VTSGRPHVVVLHRWRARYAEYQDYLDHDRTAVSYVSTEVGSASVPAAAAEVALVEATDDLAEVREQVTSLAARHGRPAAVVALKEDDLLVAARLRQEWDCPGPRPAQLVPLRDKLRMAERVHRAGLALPAFGPATDVETVREFGDRHGWPVIVKPRRGSSSAGVTRIAGPADCHRLSLNLAGGPMMVQQFDPRPIYHVDGYFDGKEIGPARVSRYLNTCLGFRSGDSLGSVEMDDPRLVGVITAFSARALAALADFPTVFHLELFADIDGAAGGGVVDGTGACSFLEVGARVGGAEIPFIWREVHGYDLMGAGFRLQLGQAPPPWPDRLAQVAGEGGRLAGAASAAKSGAKSGAGSEGTTTGSAQRVGGWLLVPAPASRPCRITEASSMLGRPGGPYAEVLLRPGEVLPAADAYYEHVGGRFRFRGHRSAEVAVMIEETTRDVRIGGERVAQVPGVRPAQATAVPLDRATAKVSR